METESRPHLAPALAEKLGRFEIVTRLGQGGMAEVFLAVQRGAFSSNKLVVIKKLKRDANDEHQMFEMFVDEARIAMRLTHPNVVNTFDFVAEGDEFYLTMEFLDGQSLLQTIRKVGRDKLPLELHIWILIQVLAGLGYAHGLRDFDGTQLAIVHRDVTPSNVILTYGGGVKLVDFGIAKVAGAMAVTQNGTMKGKLGYASPEQCLGKPTTARSDLYSVGVMLWEAMAGRRRTVGETPAAIYQARIAGTERRIEDVWLDAPPNLIKIVRRALASAPEDRYATASEFQRDLEDYLANAAPGTSGTLVLGDFMSAHFAQEMETLHRAIESRVSGTPSAPGSAGLRAVSMADRRERTSDNVTLSTPEVRAVAPEKRPSQRRLVATIIGIAVVVVVAIFAVRGGGSTRQPASVAAAAVVQPAGPPPVKAGVAALVPPPASAPPAPAGNVRVAPVEPIAAPAVGLAELRIAVRPRVASARIAVDGDLLQGNPAVTSRPKDHAEHVLTVTAEGYEPIERVVTFDRDVSLSLRLTRHGARASEPAPVEQAARPRSQARGFGETPAAPSGARAASHDPTEPDEGPGADLHRAPLRGHEPRHIDEKDPYTP